MEQGIGWDGIGEGRWAAEAEYCTVGSKNRRLTDKFGSDGYASLGSAISADATPVHLIKNTRYPLLCPCECATLLSDSISTSLKTS